MEEKKPLKIKFKTAIIIILTAIVLLGIGANVYATKQGYDNIFFLIKYKLSGQPQETITGKDNLLTDRDVTTNTNNTQANEDNYIENSELIGNWEPVFAKENGKEISLMKIYGSAGATGTMNFNSNGKYTAFIGTYSSENEDNMQGNYTNQKSSITLTANSGKKETLVVKVIDGVKYLERETGATGRYVYFKKSISNNKNNENKTEANANGKETQQNNIDTSSKENIILYNGMEISKNVGVQDVVDMKKNNENMKKYNTTYYNYENGESKGTRQGTFGKETYDGVSRVENVSKIAMTKNYNAIPRRVDTIGALLDELRDLGDYSDALVNKVDLDNDGNEEFIVCYEKNERAGDYENGEARAISGITLYDKNLKKISDLVVLENGFWGNIKDEQHKVFLSINDIEYIDIDEDGIMEIIIKVPTYEGTKISILKYNKGTLQGVKNLKASVAP